MVTWPSMLCVQFVNLIFATPCWMYKHKYLVLHCCFSYHALLELQYIDKWNKSVAAKKWAQAEGISVREVEQHLDADLFLDKYPWWPPMPCHLTRDVCTCQNGREEFKQAIHCGHQQPFPGLDTKVEVPAIQLVGFKTTRDEIWELYNDVYQLKRSPG